VASAYKTLERVRAKLYWDLRENFPLAFRTGNLVTTLHLTPPGDAYPVVGTFYRHVFNVIRDYFESSGSSFEGIIPKRKTILANKVQYADLAVEIVIDSQVVGHIIYDIAHSRWRFRPLYSTVYKMIEKETGFFAKTSLPRLSRGFVIKSGDIISANLPKSDEYIALASRDYRYLGVGVLLKNRRIYVLKSWTRTPYGNLEGDPNWSKVVSVHRQYLEEKKEEAVSFIRSIYEKYKLPVVISFSGGKDSLVTLHLVLEALGNEKVTVLFNNTGIEFPETVEYVKKTADFMGLNLIIANAGEAFWRGFSVMGPPARDFRWCCKVTKFAPTARVLKQIFPDGALSFVGQRKFESVLRARSPRVWQNAWLPGIIAASPIHEWTALDVWLYIFMERLPLNPLYYYGLDRLGCWLCPASEMGEFELAKSVRRDLYERWEKELESFALSHSLGRDWLRLGLWRWVKVPKDISRLAESVQEDNARGATVSWHLLDSMVVFKLENPRQVPTLTKLQNLSHTSKELLESIESISFDEKEITVKLTRRDKSIVEQLERVVIRAFYCVECLECANWCPRGAIRLDKERGGILVLEDNCIQCGICNAKCPIAEYTLKLKSSKADKQSRSFN
jgi:phosphoadenosine phosphosulfate reductase